MIAACEHAGIANPSKFDRTRVLGLALLALGGTGSLAAAARAYKKTVDEGVIG